MKSLAKQISNKCTHYNGLSGPGLKNDEATRCCKAGIVYLTVKSQAPDRTGFGSYPCFREGEGVPCSKRHFPTAEEVEAEVAEHDAHWEKLKAGMLACQEDAKKHGYKKGSGGRGSIPCPACGTGELFYSVAGYNGHMHGKCSTPDCLSWMQ